MHVGWSAGVRKPPMNETAGGGAPLSAGAMGIWIARSVLRRSRKAGAGADCWGDICGRYGDFALEGWRCKAGWQLLGQERGCGCVHVAVSGDYQVNAWQMA
jgi:hypothetical protein